jgi:hypothetical protein
VERQIAADERRYTPTKTTVMDRINRIYRIYRIYRLESGTERADFPDSVSGWFGPNLVNLVNPVH